MELYLDRHIVKGVKTMEWVWLLLPALAIGFLVVMSYEFVNH